MATKPKPTKYWKVLQPARGSKIGKAKLRELDVAGIKSAVRQRENLKQHIRDNLSNEALAKAHGVHVRTIEKVLAKETWGHVA
jgi:hypothetical protein